MYTITDARKTKNSEKSISTVLIEKNITKESCKLSLKEYANIMISTVIVNSPIINEKNCAPKKVLSQTQIKSKWAHF